MAGKDYQPWTPKQSYLLPPSPLQWLPEGHLAYFILDVVEQLDLTAIDAAIQERDARGQRPYAPRMMTALLLYAYCVGIFSSRRIERATHEDVACRVLAANGHPHFTTINQFRLEHRKALAELFVQVLRLCRKAGLVRLGRVAVDGTKVKANASKHKAMSHQRMKDEEKRLQAEIETLFNQADETDRAEDQRFGVGCRARGPPNGARTAGPTAGDDSQRTRGPGTRGGRGPCGGATRNAQAQRERAADPSIDATERKRAATRANRSRQKARDLASDNDDDEPPPGSADLPSHRVPPTERDGTPKPSAQRNFTDPDSRIMLGDGAFLQAYNAQIAVDEDWQVIVATASRIRRPTWSTCPR